MGLESPVDASCLIYLIGWLIATRCPRMTVEAETTIEWDAQIAFIRQRYEAALRSGETIDELDAWLRQVPEPIRPQLREQLEQCGAKPNPSLVETHVQSSDAALGCAHQDDRLFSLQTSTRTDAVLQCSTFQGLSRTASEALSQRLEPVRFAAGTELLRQGEAARGLYLILNGSVDIVDTESASRIDLGGAGTVLGEMSLLTGQPCSAAVTAMSNVGALVLSTESYEQLRLKHPELEIALSQLVSDRLGGRRHDALCGKTMGRYQLVRCINRGGMGVVYEAKHLGNAEPVALKMLRHRFIYDDVIQSRFDLEAELLGGLRHPNVVSFRDHFLAYRTRFLVLDLCDGSDLFRLVRKRGPLDETTVRAILGQIAKGLLYAHQSGVVHRDLKPGNVLVDRNGQVRLADFGLSKLIESEVSENKAVGTPSYMPPEQFSGGHVGPEGDWYALGCLACEMLSGRILFVRGSWAELSERKRHQAPSDDWPKINASSDIRELIHGALQPNIEKRQVDLEAISEWADKVEGLFGDEEPD